MTGTGGEAVKKKRRGLDRARAVVYPDRCALCGRLIPYATQICSDCRRNAPVIRGKRCFACGLPQDDCQCKGHANFYAAVTAPFFYRGVARQGIGLWKFRRAERSLVFFAHAVSACVVDDFSAVSFDVVTFIPQTDRERAFRGYNQGERLARAVGELLQVDVKPLLIKLYETQRQHALPWYRRSGNIFGVFECADCAFVSGKTILLIDDIKTSGRTLNECAKMLHLADAAAVYCAVIAIA